MAQSLSLALRVSSDSPSSEGKHSAVHSSLHRHAGSYLASSACLLGTLGLEALGRLWQSDSQGCTVNVSTVKIGAASCLGGAVRTLEG